MKIEKMNAQFIRVLPSSVNNKRRHITTIFSNIVGSTMLFNVDNRVVAVLFSLQHWSNSMGSLL